MKISPAQQRLLDAMQKEQLSILLDYDPKWWPQGRYMAARLGYTYLTKTTTVVSMIRKGLIVEQSRYLLSCDPDNAEKQKCYSITYKIAKGDGHVKSA